MPRLQQRKDIVKSQLNKLWPALKYKPALIDRVANATAGYVARDIAALCRQAGLRRLRQIQDSKHMAIAAQEGIALQLGGLADTISRLSLNDSDKQSTDALPSWSDFAHSLTIVRPSQQMEFENERPAKKWTDVGGYEEVIEKLKQSIQLATSERCTSIGVSAPRGILLHGPSGCGKTAMALAMIAESGCSVISIRAPELFSKYLGETEAKLRRLFAAARTVVPCIVFIDEVDSLAAKRKVASEQIGGPELRILSTLLNEMDGVHNTSRVVVVGCTNQIERIDEAILRPGRFDQHIEVGLPTAKDRVAILTTFGNRSRLADGVDIGNLAEATCGFTGAALERLFREAGLSALRRKGLETDTIEMCDFEKAFADVGAEM
ncbi:P-loop containing nucleoside triphosphate hydrolase protein [Coemansia spiralis]|nr:P-loop containing nucleoside triphosphate hydrolase protein [Coemansia spiralis]